MKYTIKIEGLKKLDAAFKRSPKIVYKELVKGIAASINIIRPMMAREAPFSSGKLRSNIYARTVGLRGEVGPNIGITPYAWYVHQGTRAHTIVPVTKKALYWPGAAHPVKMVRHPGTKPNPFVERTATKMRVPVQNIFRKTTDRIVKQLIR